MCAYRIRGIARTAKPGDDQAVDACGAVGLGRRGAGVSHAAPITRRNARVSATIPRGSLAIGSPKTMIPPTITETFAAALMMVITGTASPVWKARADA